MDLAAVIVFDDPFGKGKAEAPSQLFGGEPRFEHRSLLAGRNALSRIRNVNMDLFRCFGDGYPYHPFSFHRIERVPAEVLDHPSEERFVEADLDVFIVPFIQLIPDLFAGP